MKLLATRDSLAECLHTALRKLCDSTITSLLWNIIASYRSEAEFEVWDKYLDNVWNLLKLVDHVTITYEQELLLA